MQEGIEWAENVLRPDSRGAPRAPAPRVWMLIEPGHQKRDALASQVVKPAFGRWDDVLRELLPRARSADESGLGYMRLAAKPTTPTASPCRPHFR